jgi:hypothetical protein
MLMIEDGSNGASILWEFAIFHGESLTSPASQGGLEE